MSKNFRRYSQQRKSAPLLLRIQSQAIKPTHLAGHCSISTSQCSQQPSAPPEFHPCRYSRGPSACLPTEFVMYRQDSLLTWPRQVAKATEDVRGNAQSSCNPFWIFRRQGTMCNGSSAHVIIKFSSNKRPRNVLDEDLDCLRLSQQHPCRITLQSLNDGQLVSSRHQSAQTRP